MPVGGVIHDIHQGAVAAFLGLEPFLHVGAPVIEINTGGDVTAGRLQAFGYGE